MKINKTSFIFELVHCDLWGPYRVQTTQGWKYFLTIVDDFSRATWTFLMSNKKQVSSLFSHFLALVQNQFNHTIKITGTDNDTEFFNQTMSTHSS